MEQKSSLTSRETSLLKAEIRIAKCTDQISQLQTELKESKAKQASLLEREARLKRNLKKERDSHRDTKAKVLVGCCHGYLLGDSFIVLS